MADWITWFIAAGILVTFEMFTGTFYLLMIALGVTAGGFAAFVGAGDPIQYIVAAVVGAAATYALRRSNLGKAPKNNPARDPNVNLDIGQTLVINEWKDDQGKGCTARAMYRGAMWDVELAHGATAQPGAFLIREIRGSRLIVSNHQTSDNTQ
jgi:membrane protein implicated in regulation of membrane protease activity